MKYDIIIIGSGWAGFNAAMEAVSHNLTVALIEKDALGGTCLNYGCIPTKAFVASASHFYDALHSSEFGINTAPVELNFLGILQRKDKIVARLRQGLDGLIRAKKVNLIVGQAKIIDPYHVQVNKDIIEANNIIIATGSRPRELPNLKFDATHIISSTDILKLEKRPESLLVIGGGVIGCEFAGIYSQLGTKVTIVELLERILIGADKEVSKKMEITFKKKGVNVLVGTNFSTLNLAEFDKVLLCIGRSANIEGIGLEEIGLKIEKGFICTDEHLRTNIPNIYAIGDCIGGYQLAHVAAYEGRIAVENILGKDKSADYTAVPSCIFTNPEIGIVGLSEDEAKTKGFNVKVAKFSFLGLGMAHIKGETDGFIKIVVDADSEKVLGSVIFGLGATELISVLAMAMRNNLSIKDIYETIFPHPALSESIAEAAHNFYAA